MDAWRQLIACFRAVKHLLEKFLVIVSIIQQAKINVTLRRRHAHNLVATIYRIHDFLRVPEATRPPVLLLYGPERFKVNSICLLIGGGIK
jgi:hypothetical protein